MNNLKIAVVGASGKIGLEIIRLIKDSAEFKFCGGVSRSAGNFHSLKSEVKIDVMIDFSSPEVLAESLMYAKAHQIPLVVGTTGLAERHHDLMKEAAREVPILYSPNMSVGVAILKLALEAFATAKNFDFQIEEWHHKHKKDAPSGTAILLQDRLEQVVGHKCPGPLSVRGGGIFGVHKVVAMSEEETLVFEHTALNRTVFARGALTAARWLVGQPKSLYNMDHLMRAVSK